MINANIFKALPLQSGHAQTYFGSYTVYRCARRGEWIAEFINEFGLATTVATFATIDGEADAAQACHDHYERILFHMLTPQAQNIIKKWKI